MSAEVRGKDWWPYFVRTLRFLGPHRRPLVIGLVAAIGVSLFYTFSISSTIPLLKVIFAEHETLVDWMYRTETQRRLDVVLAADLPDNPHGLSVDHVRPDSKSADVLHDGDRVVSVGGQRLSSYELMRYFASFPDKRIESVVLEDSAGQQRTVMLKLRAYHSWSQLLGSVAQAMPAGKDSNSRLNTLIIVMAALVAVSILGAAFRVLNEGLVALAVQGAMHDLRCRLADHVMRLPVAWHSDHPPGDTISRFATDIGKVEVGMTTLFGKTIREPLKAAGVLALTLFIDYKLLLVALVGLPIGGVVMRAFGRTVKRAQKRASQSWGRLLDHLSEKLAGIRIVKAYSMQETESRRFDTEGRTLTRAQTHIEVVDAATNPVLETLAVIGVAAFVIYGGSRVFSQELEPHLFFAAVVCMGGIFDPVRKMGNVNNRLQQADASAKRLYELLDQPSEEATEQTHAARFLPSFRERIEFRGVSFAYPAAPDRLVIEDVDLTVRKGQVVALVGPNGSGKTTLMALLMRFFNPTRGRILIDGQDIADVALESLRSQIGLVTQDAVIFSGSVKENIAYAPGEDADEEMVRRAARLAHIDDFVQSLAGRGNGSNGRCDDAHESPGPHRGGYDALITSRSLSGGQRQRIALARAIFRDPPILIFDEATSQIDSESERKIQEALEDVIQDRTVFIIAHRFSTIAHADMTVVLNEGRVVSCGRHAELLESCPFYVKLCETQFAQGVQTG